MARKQKQVGDSTGLGTVQVPKEIEQAVKAAPPQIRSAKEVAEQTAARAKEAEGFADWLASALPRLDEYEAAPAGVQAQMRDEVEVARDYLRGILNHQDDMVRRAAWMAMLGYRLGQTFKTHEYCQEMFDRMVGQGLLIPTNRPDAEAALPGGVVDGYGPSTIYGQTYNLPNRVKFGEKDIADLRARAKDLRTRTQAAVKHDRRVRADELASRATISLEQCRDHIPGLVVFDVATREVNNGEGKKTQQGGRLLMKSDGTKLYLEDAVNEPGYGGIGVFERKIREMMAMRSKPHLFIDATFGGKKPHFRPGSMPQEMINKVFLLACMVIRAIEEVSLDAKPQTQEAPEAVAEEATTNGAEADQAAAKTDDGALVSAVA